MHFFSIAFNKIDADDFGNLYGILTQKGQQ